MWCIGCNICIRVRNVIKSQKLNSPHTSKRQADFSTFQSSYVHTRLILSRFLQWGITNFRYRKMLACCMQQFAHFTRLAFTVFDPALSLTGVTFQETCLMRTKFTSKRRIHVQSFLLFYVSGLRFGDHVHLLWLRWILFPNAVYIGLTNNETFVIVIDVNCSFFISHATINKFLLDSCFHFIDCFSAHINLLFTV